MIELVDIRVFAKICELMSVSAAAEVLGMPKSSVSRSLTRLEAHLGVALLYRSNRKLALTDTGLLFAEDARKILLDVEEAEQKVGQIRHTPRGLLRVSVPVTPGQWMIAPLVADYLQLYPEVQIALSLTSHKIDPMADEFDVVIRTGALEDSGLVAKRLGTVSLMLLAAPAYLDIHGAPKTPADLAQHSLLDIYAGNIEWRLYDGTEVETVQVHTRFSANDTSTIRTVLLGGLGIGWLPDYLCQEDLASGRLAHVLPQWNRGDRDIHAVFPRHRTVSPKVRSFIDFLSERFRYAGSR
ncbi:LysR family transcriptional regulator [Cupriavidus basilensis OR16]|uniref:LysR family transcriptional regulator n=1 Tax=Cupriavidus basilensis OR16 TaxID=1127483 RepID=H1S3X6_9BURK|nr:LysR family transcriptional regulator [Cupriavidus basilensis]EHP42776.1 LysR family transcriptional regulator [Cupriavidus basilensis OR16]